LRKTDLKRFVFILGALSVGAAILAAQTTVFVVRHADREAPEPDPPLTARGERQAEALARLLRDAHVRHIYTTEFQRTEQTAAPLARISKVTPEVVPQSDLPRLVERIRKESGGSGALLVVGHRSTVPRIVKALTGVDIAPLGPAEYDRLLVVTLFHDGKSSVLTLRYGGGCGAEVDESKVRKSL
jgi:phosphohistidine phosphatase SixA